MGHPALTPFYDTFARLVAFRRRDHGHRSRRGKTVAPSCRSPTASSTASRARSWHTICRRRRRRRCSPRSGASWQRRESCIPSTSAPRAAGLADIAGEDRVV